MYVAKIAVLGYGTVGSGVVEVINTNNEIVSKNSGEKVEIKYVLDLRDFPGDPVQNILTHNFDDILNDSEVEVVVEVMGGIKPAYDFVKSSLLAGKSVCTSNKALVAAHGDELMSIAKKNDVSFLFEASVGGGIPIIRPLNRCITCDKVLKIEGILNGTTNYMLTKMGDDDMEYEDVLADAQQKGYAERNPEADVEGHDACRKIAILASMVTGKKVDFTEIPTEGITKISKTVMEYAKALGASVKLIGSAKFEGEKVWARVAPTLVYPNSPLYAVKDVFNAISVTGNMLGEVMFYGQGAGKSATASAVVSDVVELVKYKKNIYTAWTEEKQVLSDTSELVESKLIRVIASDTEKAKTAVKNIFGVSEFTTLPSKNDEFVFISKKEAQGVVCGKIEELGKAEGVKEIKNVIVVEEIC